jgi:hypothetical protein
MIILTSRLPVTTGRTAHNYRRSRQPTRLLDGPPTTTTQMGRIMLDRQGCHHLSSTSSNHGIGPHPATRINQDTISTLISDALVSRAEPSPSGWTNIVLEKIYEYWNHCHGTRFTLLIMQGIRYE